MSLAERIKEDIIKAQKARDEERLGTLRFLSAQLKNKEIEKRSAGQSDVLTDEDIIGVLVKEIKKRKDAVDLYSQGGRKELADKENREMEIISLYVPEQLSEEELEAEIGAIIESAGSLEFPVLMKTALAKLAGKTDGSSVARIIKARIAK